MSFSSSPSSPHPETPPASQELVPEAVPVEQPSEIPSSHQRAAIREENKELWIRRGPSFRFPDHGKGGGRRKNVVFEALVIEGKEAKLVPDGHGGLVEREFKRAWCMGCDSHSGLTELKRARNHAMACNAIKEDFPNLATALAHNLQQHALSSATQQASQGSQHSIGSAANPPPSQPSLANYVSTDSLAITPWKQKQIDLQLLKTIVVGALPFSLLDLPEFKALLHEACPAYQLPDRTRFFDEHLPQECAKIQAVWLQYLGNHNVQHLTLSTDGWSTRASMEVYTFHFTNPQGNAHLFSAELLGDKTATAEVLGQAFTRLANTALPTTGTYLHERISAVCSDSASSLQKAKETFAHTYPWVLVIPDAPHWLNLFAKDICKQLPGLQQLINSLASLVRYLNSSNNASSLLAQERQRLGQKHGIVAIGETRFATVYWSAKSVLSNMKALQAVSSSFPWKGETKSKLAPLLSMRSLEHIGFYQGLEDLVTVLEPLANGIKTLEGKKVTLSNVFSIWIAIAWNWNRLAQQQEESSLIKSNQTILTKLFNTRLAAFLKRYALPQFGDTNILLLSWLLDPANRDLQCAKLDLSMVRKELKLTESDAHFSSLVRLLIELDEKELMRTGARTSQSRARRLKDQFGMYLKGKEPFTGPATEPLPFWNALSTVPESKELSLIATKLFSIQATSMSEERTASTLSWFDAARRSSLKPANLIWSVQYRQHCVEQREESSHKAKKTRHIPAVRTAYGPALAPPTRLQEQMQMSRFLNPEENLSTPLELWQEDLEEPLEQTGTPATFFSLEDYLDLGSRQLGRFVGGVEPDVEDMGMVSSDNEEQEGDIDFDDL